MSCKRVGGIGEGGITFSQMQYCLFHKHHTPLKGLGHETWVLIWA